MATDTPGASSDKPLFDVYANAGYIIKFILPLVVVAIGLVEFAFSIRMLVCVTTRLRNGKVITYTLFVSVHSGTIRQSLIVILFFSLIFIFLDFFLCQFVFTLIVNMTIIVNVNFLFLHFPFFLSSSFAFHSISIFLFFLFIIFVHFHMFYLLFIFWNKKRVESSITGNHVYLFR